MKRIFAFAAADIVGSAIGAYSAATMSGLLPGDRRTIEGISISGWNGSLDQGSSDASPYVRARIARHGLLAMAKSEAIYFTRATDDAGSPLRETCRYRLSGGPLPAGWWSVTLYNADNFLPDHEFSIPGQLVADATVSEVTSSTLPYPRMVVTCALLLLEDA